MTEPLNQIVGHEYKPDPHFSYEGRQPQKSSNLLLFLLIAVLVGLVGFGGYYAGKSASKPAIQYIASSPMVQVQASPVVGEATVWKTYTNERYAYAINYPHPWRIFNENISGSDVNLSNPTVEGGQNIFLRVTEDTIDNSKYIFSYFNPTSKPEKIGSVTINDTVGEKWSFNQTSTDDNYAIFLDKNGKKYILIKELGNVDKFKEYSSQIDQILSTFKFVN